MRAAFLSFFLFVPQLSLASGGAMDAPVATWERTVKPGVLYRFFNTEDNKRIHVAEVDLTNPHVRLRASRPEEKGLVPTAFAKAAETVVAINADFFNSRRIPMGLAVGGGQVWPDSVDTDNWSFLACDESNACEIDTSGQARPTSPSWTNVVGGWQVLLKEGFAWEKSDDVACGEFCTVAHPRTAVGLDTLRRTLFLVMVEGRQGVVTGFSLARLSSFLASLGAATALNLDGGGSSGLVVEDVLVNKRPTAEPAERPVSNCLGVQWIP